MPITPHSALVRLRYHTHCGGPQCKTEIDKLDPAHWGQQDGGAGAPGKMGWESWACPDWSRGGFMALEGIQVDSPQWWRVREQEKKRNQHPYELGNRETCETVLTTRSYSNKKKLFKAIKHLQTVKIFIDASANMGMRNIIFLF